MTNTEKAECEGTCESKKDCCGSGCKCSPWKTGLALTLVFILVHAVAFPFASEYLAKRVAGEILQNEYEKVGGKEVYDLLNKAQAIQLKSQLPTIKAYLESAAKEDTGSTTTEKEAATITSDEIASIQKNSYLEGNKDARFIAVEYTDLECPFCIRQFHDGIMKQLSEKYGTEFAHILKPFRAVAHEGAEPKAVASLCVASIGGAEKYSAFYSKILSDSDTKGKVYPVADLAKLAKEVGVDQAKFNACYAAKQTTSLYDAYTAEGKKYGASGTPGTLIIDTKTGKTAFVNGAQAITSFVSAIEGLK